MSFRKYPSYQDSVVDWVQSVPSHWKHTRIKHIARAGDKSFIDGDWIEAPFITTAGVRLLQCGNVGTGVFEEQGFRYISEETFRTFGCTEVEQNDVLICRLQSSRTILAGRACLAPRLGVKMITSVDNCILKASSDFDPRYVVYQLSIPAYLSFIEVVARGGTRDRISRSMLGSIEVVAPPVEEQTAIAAFLDRETGKIDALVAEQRRLMELLQEKRQAVISHAVTKGLNPDASLKPSGIDWLGDVPAHWDVIALKRVASVRTGVAKGKDNSDRQTISVPYLRVANVQDGYLDLGNVSKIDIPVEELERYSLKTGDVLMNEGGDFDKLGRGHVWEGQIVPCITQNHVFAVRPERVSSVWLNTITGSDYAQFYFMSRSKQSTNLASISSTNLMELPVVIPPESEQAAILSFISAQTSAFNGLIAEAQRAIALLQERRTALISAAVTGKIDIRGLAETEAA